MADEGELIIENPARELSQDKDAFLSDAQRERFELALKGHRNPILEYAEARVVYLLRAFNPDQITDVYGTPLEGERGNRGYLHYIDSLRKQRDSLFFVRAESSLVQPIGKDSMVFSPIEAVKGRDQDRYDRLMGNLEQLVNQDVAEEKRRDSVIALLNLDYSDEQSLPLLRKDQYNMLIRLTDKTFSMDERTNAFTEEQKLIYANRFYGLYLELYGTPFERESRAMEKVMQSLGQKDFWNFFSVEAGNKEEPQVLGYETYMRIANTFFHGSLYEAYGTLAKLAEQHGDSEEFKTNWKAIQKIGRINCSSAVVSSLLKDGEIWQDANFESEMDMAEIYFRGNFDTLYKTLASLDRAGKLNPVQKTYWNKLDKAGAFVGNAETITSIINDHEMFAAHSGFDLYTELAKKYYKGSYLPVYSVMRSLHNFGKLDETQEIAWRNIEQMGTLACKVEDITDFESVDWYLKEGFPNTFLTRDSVANITVMRDRFGELYKDDMGVITRADMARLLLKFPKADLDALQDAIETITLNDELRPYIEARGERLAQALQEVVGLETQTVAELQYLFSDRIITRLINIGTSYGSTVSMFDSETGADLLAKGKVAGESVTADFVDEVERREEIAESKEQVKTLLQEFNEVAPGMGELMIRLALAEDPEQELTAMSINVEDFKRAWNKLVKKISQRFARKTNKALANADLFLDTLKQLSARSSA